MNAVARLAAAASLALAASGAQAVSIDAGTWYAFDFYDDIESAAWVDLDLAPMSFEFVLTGPAVLRVVDGGLAGDRFEVKANGVVLGTTSAPADAGDTSHDFDFVAAFADGRWSRGSYELGAGSYSITGRAVQFGVDLVAGSGGLMFSPMPVPEPGSWALLATGGLMMAGALRRARR